MPRSRSLRVLLVLVALVLLNEIGLRLLIGQNSTWNVRLGAMKRFDPDTRFRLKANYELAGGVVTNEHGFLAPPGLTHEKAPDALRIVYVGDSVSVLPVVASFPAQTEAIVARETGRRVETLNAAVPGYTSVEARTLFENEVSAYEADHFVVHLGWNDLGQYGPEGIPYKRHHAGYELTPVQRALTEIYTLRLLYVADHFARRMRPVVSEPLGAEDEALYTSYHPTHYEENLRAILALAKSRYPNVLLMNLASVTNPDPTPSELARTHFPAGIDNNMRKLDMLVETYNRVVAAVAAEESVEMLDLHALFDSREARERFTDACHFDREGAGRVAAVVAEWVLRTSPAAQRPPSS